ncbi:MAG TPA: hypothetical protein VK973_16005 [Arenicellales bacterium]|nr:hypothetical protein [Arenicellales bacterium]
MKTAIQVLALLGGTALLAGCYDSADVTVHEPGEYKGTSDPLLNSDAESRAETLEERFKLVQTDR